MNHTNDRVSPPPASRNTRNGEDHDEKPPNLPWRSDADAAATVSRTRRSSTTLVVPTTRIKKFPSNETLVEFVKENSLVIEVGSGEPPRRGDKHTRVFRSKIKQQAKALGVHKDALLTNCEAVASSSRRHGAVAISGTSIRPVDDDSASQNLESIIAEPLAADPMELEKQVVAQLVPHDEYIDVEAMIALKVEERLKHHKNENSSSTLVFEAEEVDDSTTSLGGFQRRTIWMLVILVVLVIGGVVVGALYSLGGNDDSVRSPSSAPTTLADHPLLDELRSLNALSDEALSLFSDPTSSAQSKALTWLKTDTIVLSPSRSTQDLLQRYVLAVLYFSTSRPNWTWSYLSNDDVCTWNNGTKHRHGVYCQADGVSIDELILDDNSLQGPLPWELVLLTNLEILSLSKNALTGSIPTRISELTRLRTFDAARNDLTGPLPTTFSSETTQIRLDDNDLVGSIPQGWGTSMPGLEVIWLYANKLTGSLPTTIAQLSGLQHLDVSWNQVTGALPSELGQMVSLTNFNLLSNQLSGTIPSELGHMLSLNYLSIGDNALTGTIPTEVGQLTSLTLFDIYENKFTGTIPSELGQLNSLEKFSISVNSLTGSIPSELGLLLSLGNLSIKDNRLTGTIPSELGGVGALRSFDFAVNLLTGSLDERFCTGNRTWTWLFGDCYEVDCECCTSCL